MNILGDSVGSVAKLMVNDIHSSPLSKNPNTFFKKKKKKKTIRQVCKVLFIFGEFMLILSSSSCVQKHEPRVRVFF